jgi:hypothetical protein
MNTTTAQIPAGTIITSGASTATVYTTVATTQTSPFTVITVPNGISSTISMNAGDTQAVITLTAPASHTVQQSMQTTLPGLGQVWVVGAVDFYQFTIGFLPIQTAISINSNQIIGANWTLPTTRFQDQLRVNDRFTVRGMVHQVTSIQGQGVLTFNPPYRGASSITSATPVKCCKIKELRVPQSQFNRDTIDGRGPSGYKVDLSRQQMIGIQYTWYGAGFVDFMIRGPDGNWVMCHRIKNNNVNDEAYMRSGNLPVRYELSVESRASVSTLSSNLNTTQTTVSINDSTTPFPPSGGTLLIDNELVSYTGTTPTSFTGCTRAAALNYNVSDTPRTFTGQGTGPGAGTTHLANTSVNLISCTATPTMTHWGSSFLTDGQFDFERGYYFNYSNTSVILGGLNSVTIPLQQGLPGLVAGGALTFAYGGQSLTIGTSPVVTTATNPTTTQISVTTTGVTTAAIPVGTIVTGPAGNSQVSGYVAAAVPSGTTPPFILSIASVTSQFSVGDNITLASAGTATGPGLPMTVSSITALPPSITITYTGTFATIPASTQVTNTTQSTKALVTASSITSTASSATTAFAIRLAPSVTNGFSGDIGTKELLNRAQLLLQKLEVTSPVNMQTIGFLNPTGVYLNPANWVNINNLTNGTQPSFAQYYGASITGTPQPGERIFQTIVQAANQNNLDLSNLKELTNGCIGGNQSFPDGPDVLLIYCTNLTATSATVQVNLFWSEAQA